VTDEQNSNSANDAEDRRREQLHESKRTELIAQQSSNSEAYDKAVLTLSSAFLGISLAFIKDFAGDTPLGCTWLLVVSWGAFGFAIIAAVASFQVGNKAIEIQLERAERYYIQRDETAHSKTRFAQWVDYVNWASGSLFVLGVFLTIVFVSINLHLLESHSVSRISKSGPTHAHDAQPISNMTKVERAQPITSMPKVPQAPAPTPAPAPAKPADQKSP
jgi:hypothetical protein